LCVAVCTANAIMLPLCYPVMTVLYVMRPIVIDGVAWSVCRSVSHDHEPCARKIINVQLLTASVGE